MAATWVQIVTAIGGKGRPLQDKHKERLLRRARTPACVLGTFAMRPVCRLTSSVPSGQGFALDAGCGPFSGFLQKPDVGHPAQFLHDWRMADMKAIRPDMRKRMHQIDAATASVNAHKIPLIAVVEAHVVYQAGCACV